MENQKSAMKIFFFYVCSLALGALLFWSVERAGARLYPTGPGSTIALAPSGNPLLHILLALVVVIFVARLIGEIFRRLRQPPVLGEVLGGILLGPSLLGRYFPETAAYILPTASAPLLGMIAQLGIILYMFLVGLELDLRVLKRSGHATLAISHMSILIPFLLGSALALQIYSDLAPPGIGFLPFALFLGVSMSVTAFPVLARILSDQGLQRTPIGQLALTCAAIDDVTAWCLLALVVSVAQATMINAYQTFALTFAFILFMFLLARPLVKRAVRNLRVVGEVEMAIILIVVLLSALATESIGIHAIFGAFLLGAVSPADNPGAHQVREKLIDIVRVMFLPAFFAFTGLRTEIALVSGAADWLLVGLIIVIATIGKFGGTFVAAKFSGATWRDSVTLGVLMNTRGLVELIVLNVGLDIGVISPRLFTMLVIMALVTTFMTGPLLTALNPREQLPN